MSQESKKIYFSASIRGENADPELGYKVVSHLRSLGHDVLSEHVGSRTRQEMDEVLQRRSGVDKNALSPEEAARFIRRIDTQWVDESEFMVVVATGASFGVGMEIERAVTKPERGLNHTPVLCFVPASYLPALSAMVSGIVEPGFTIVSYVSYEDIERELNDRLR